MIIDFPTALYLSAVDFPVNPGDRGNVTFTISSEDPPRINVDVPPLFKSEELRSLPDRIYNAEERLVSFGPLVSTLSFVSTATTAIGTKAFEIGEILEFSDDTITLPSQALVPDKIDLNQDTNYIDLMSLGMSEDDALDLSQKARALYDSLVSDINNLKTNISDLETTIQNNQKILNEVKKTKNAALLIFGVTGNNLLDKLSQKETDLTNSTQLSIDQINNINIDIENKYNQLLGIREIVR